MKPTREEVLTAFDEFVSTLPDGAQANIRESAARGESITKNAFIYACNLDKPLAESAVAPGECGTDLIERIADAFGMGSEARTPGTILANVENASRRSKCLSAIECEFFTVTLQDEDGEYDECPLNWGAEPDEYVEQFRDALASRSGMQPPNNQPNSHHVAVTSAEPESRLRDLLAGDGENRAVRTFLQLYGGCTSVTTQRMRNHLTMSGFEHYWPAWTNDVEHLTKGGAQDWLRYLFALESGISSLAGRPNEQKSYVGNFGDTGEAQLRRELANVPLPNYMEGK